MIGVFDSGYGGLTILKDLLKSFPDYDYFYLGDNGKAPYGNRSYDTLVEFTEQAIEYLFDQGCVLIITACNTVSSNVLRHLQSKYLRERNILDRKILGVIKPQAEEAIKITKNKCVGVVGTRSTIASKSYEIEISHLDPEVKVFTQSCPLLVPLIEENWHQKPETKMILKKYLRPLKSCNVDTLILGCTHYPILLKEFRKVMGKRVKILNPGEIVAKSLENYLQRHPEIEMLISKHAKRIYTTTDDAERFKMMGSQFLGQPIKEVKKIHL